MHSHETNHGKTVRQSPPLSACSAGDLRILNIVFINAVLPVLENGCKWRALLESWDEPAANAPLAMDRAYEGDETRRLVEEREMTPAVLPKANRKAKRNYDRETYKRWNEIDRLLRRLKSCRRI